MKVCILSDLHLEIFNIKFSKIDCDIMVLAGDIGTGTMAKDFIMWHLENGVKHILYVFGNHEFWNKETNSISKFFNPTIYEESSTLSDSYQYTIDQWLELDKKIERLHVLHNKEFIYKNIRFLGTTLWTDFNKKIENQYFALNNINDYKYITYQDRNLQPHDVFNFHIKAKKWLINNLEPKEVESKLNIDLKVDLKTVVISHHLPSYNCIDQKYKDSFLNSSFASNLDKLMEKYKIDYWIHGHTHSSIDTLLYDTRIICNPRGYTRIINGSQISENSLFDDKYVIEI